MTSNEGNYAGGNIHATAIVEPGAVIGEGVTIGPYSIIGSDVTIGAGCTIGGHVIIDGHTIIGENNRIFTGAIVGSQAQDLKCRGGRCRLIIGNDNTIREYVTINTSTSEENETRIGSGNLLMAYAHVAHECEIRDMVIMANNATLAGHVIVENKAMIGGLVAVHQFVRLGSMAIIGGGSKVTKDVMPYSMVDGHPARWHGVNFVGLKRNGISGQARSDIKKAFKIICRSNLNTVQALEQLRTQLGGTPETDHIIEFIENSSRGVCK
jgi:UDP-N-acetylglucosamine acyltransferase